MSLAIKHKRNALAKAAAKKQAGSTPSLAPTPSTHDHQVAMASLDRDLARLSAIDSVEEKINLKRNELLPKYLPIVDAQLDTDQQFYNPILVRCAIWALDIEDMETGVRLAEACVAQQQLPPEHFKRDLPTFFAETIADWAERQLKATQSGSPWIDRVCEYLENDTWPTTNDIVRGKVFKVAGQLAEASGDAKAALALFERAQEENERAGCKTRIEKLKAQLGAGA